MWDKGQWYQSKVHRFPHRATNRFQVMPSFSCLKLPIRTWSFQWGWNTQFQGFHGQQEIPQITQIRTDLKLSKTMIIYHKRESPKRTEFNFLASSAEEGLQYRIGQREREYVLLSILIGKTPLPSNGVLFSKARVRDLQVQCTFWLNCWVQVLLVSGSTI